MSDFGFEEEEFSASFSGKTFRRMLGQTRPHWRRLVGFLLTIALVSALDSAFTYMGKQIVDQGILANDRAALRTWVTLYGGLIFIQAVGVFTFIFLAGVLGERIRYDLRRTLFSHLQQLSLSYFDRTPVGWIISRVTSDTDRVAELLTWGLLDVSWGIMNTTTAVIFMLIINWRMALIVLASVPLIAIAAIHDVILSFPEGYDTLVGERGVTLSGGQKQRVAIARTLLMDPRILILDDSTSSVDTETEALIRTALERLMRGRTSFIIAHRVQSLMIADLILVLQGARIVQRGSHAELVREEGLYRQIHAAQTRIEVELERELAGV